MDAISQTLIMWQTEAIIAMAVLAAAALYYYISKGWVLPGGPSFILILGLSLCAISLLCYTVRPLQALGLSNRASFFVLLYVWCVFGMVFISGRHIHPFKILIALALQALIIYGIYLYI